MLDLRPTLVASALFATWLAMALLTVTVLSLHVRVARLEARRGAFDDPPFRGLVGRIVPDLRGGGPSPRAVVFLSTSCRTCTAIVEDLARHRWRQPVGVVWTDTAAPPFASRPDVPIVPDGPAVAASLGIRVTPFAVVLDGDGRIRHARPVGSVADMPDIDALRLAEFEPSIVAHLA